MALYTTFFFFVGSFLVEGMIFYPYSCIGMCTAVEGFNFFCELLWFGIYYLYNCSWPLYYFYWKFSLGGYDLESVCSFDLGNPYRYLTWRFCWMMGYKLYFYFCVLVCFLEVCVLECVYHIYHIYPTPPLGQDMTQGQFFKRRFNRFEFRVFLLLD